MSLLRIYGSLLDQPLHCQWALLDGSRPPVVGEGRPADLPKGAKRVQLVIPAAQVLITSARIPRGARRGAGSVLAFAVEEQTAGDPGANQVSWLGSVGETDALAVADKRAMERWHQALVAVGIDVDEVHCETLLLPLQAGEWSLAWNGCDGFIRNGNFQGLATDCGDRDSPPLCLRLMVEDAKTRGATPTSIALYATTSGVEPDLAAWQRELGVELRSAGNWDWRHAPLDAGISFAPQRQPWRIFSGALARLRPAAWILGAALTLHAVALVASWSLLGGDQRALREQMESRFRVAFPDAVAVADPALQMRRKLAEARHSAGQTDNGDFLPMIEQVAAAAKELPPGALRVMSYEGGRMILEIAANDPAAAQQIQARLLQAGLGVEMSPVTTRGTRATLFLTVRAS